MDIFNVSKVAFHRNGICGEPFRVVLFDMEETGEPVRKMVAIRFDDNQHDNPRIAVLDVAMLSQGIISMSQGNAWRGDRFADELDQYFYPDAETYDEYGVNTQNSFNTAPETA